MVGATALPLLFLTNLSRLCASAHIAGHPRALLRTSAIEHERQDGVRLDDFGGLDRRDGGHRCFHLSTRLARRFSVAA
jgi:hypothetical protein